MLQECGNIVFSCSLFLESSQDEEINQQSQLAEKLKQQMLDQEEVSAGGLMCPDRHV